jgi:hypothetical protein
MRQRKSVLRMMMAGSLVVGCGGTQEAKAAPETEASSSGSESRDIVATLERIIDAVDGLDAADKKKVWAFAAHFAGIEAGKNPPIGRVVLSLDTRAQMTALAVVFEELAVASSHIEDLFVKAPGSAEHATIDRFRRACPNLRTYWGYSSKFPEVADVHLGLWTQQTEGEARNWDVDPIRGTEMGEYVGLWSIDGGFVDPIEL